MDILKEKYNIELIDTSLEEVVEKDNFLFLNFLSTLCYNHDKYRFSLFLYLYKDGTIKFDICHRMKQDYCPLCGINPHIINSIQCLNKDVELKEFFRTICFNELSSNKELRFLILSHKHRLGLTDFF